MSKSARSIFVFSIYMFVLGLILIVIPNVLLNLFTLPETNEVWIRVVGMLILILGFYYLDRIILTIGKTSLTVRGADRK